jgi:hypothetical protein
MVRIRESVQPQRSSDRLVEFLTEPFGVPLEKPDSDR